MAPEMKDKLNIWAADTYIYLPTTNAHTVQS